MFKALIVEDEIQASDLLKNIINEFLSDKVTVVDTAKSVEEAVTKFNANSISLLFLDIDIISGTSFDVLDKIDTKNTGIIFLTAYDQYAIKAISVDSYFIDYLLKPYDINKLINSVNRLEDRLLYINKLEDPKIIISLKSETKIIRVKNIMCIVADDRYSVIYTSSEEIRVAKTLKEHEKKLMLLKHFVRVGRGTLVNTHWIHHLDLNENNIVFNNGKEVPLKDKDIKLLEDILIDM